MWDALAFVIVGFEKRKYFDSVLSLIIILHWSNRNRI